MEKPPALESELVHEFVSVAHGDLERVRNLLGKESGLLNACWDWGGGDWETPLGGASHMGRSDIAEFLLGKGARMDLFCAAMLGKVDIIRAAIQDNPDVVKTLGPHGIPLLDHALAGGADGVASLIRTLT